MRKSLAADPNRICSICGHAKVWAPCARLCWKCKTERKNQKVVDTPEAMRMRELFPDGPAPKVEDDGLPIGRYAFSQVPTEKFLTIVKKILEARG